MRLAALVLSLLVLCPPASPMPRSQSTVAPPVVSAGAPAFVTGELIVGWDVGAASAKSVEADVVATFGLEPLPAPELERLGASRMRVRDGDDSVDIAARIAAVPGVRYAEPVAVVLPAELPSDPLYAGVEDIPTDLQRWAFGGIGDNRMLDAEAAWDVTKGDPSVVIAVVDSGLDLDNPEFQTVWVNKGEIPGNGVDDDHNGFVDDVNGYDFHSERGDVRPDLGDGLDNDNNDRIDDSAPHGTIVASLISAAHDGAGLVGGAPDCALMTVKVFGDDGGVTTPQLAAAIMYASDNGADVLNLSLATLFNSQALLDAVRYALSKNVVVVAAAGNGDSGAPQYPASYHLVVSVGGSGSGFSSVAIEGLSDLGPINGRWRKSEWGLAAVKVVAPAVVYSASIATVGYVAEHPEVTAGDTIHGIFEGTSFSAPYVAALAGLVVARDKALHGKRTLSPEDVLALLERTATNLPTDHSDRRNSGPAWDGYGRVDYARALEAIPGAGTPNPTIGAVRYGKKTLTIVGDGFSGDSEIEVNGTVLAEPHQFSYANRTLAVSGAKRTLGLKKRGTNRIVVVERGTRSAEFVY
jgi:hypothetical protein